MAPGIDLAKCLLERNSMIYDDDVSAGSKSKLQMYERSNKLSLMIIKRTISKSINAGVPSYDNAKDFLEAIDQKN